MQIKLFLLVIIMLFSVSSLSAQESLQEQEGAADRLFAKAEELAKNENYNQAVLNLIFIVDYYQNYSRYEEVLYKMGMYLTDMELYSVSESVFLHIIKENKESPVVPFVLFGFEKLYHQQGNYEKAIEYFQALRTKYPEAPVGEGMYYYAGQSFFFLGDFDNAILTLSAIKPESEFWGFALYTRALAQFKKKISQQPSLT